MQKYQKGFQLFTMNYLLEVCVDSVESAVIAQKAGASRLELCSNLMIGGTTPTLALFQEVQKRVSIPIHVLIRPRFGDFLYTDAEFEMIKKEILQFQQTGANGVVIGILNSDGTLDMSRMQQLMKLTSGMSVTLHRAFDLTKDALEALEQACELGIDTILTSGQQSSCQKGKHLLAKLVQKANRRIHILVAGGVCASVIDDVFETIGTTFYHMSGKTELDSGMVFRRQGVPMGLDGINEYTIWRTDETAIRQAIHTLIQHTS